MSLINSIFGSDKGAEVDCREFKRRLEALGFDDIVIVCTNRRSVSHGTNSCYIGAKNYSNRLSSRSRAFTTTNGRLRNTFRCD